MVIVTRSPEESLVFCVLTSAKILPTSDASALRRDVGDMVFVSCVS